MVDKIVTNSYIPQEYLWNYIHTNIEVFSNDGKKYWGLFEGFDNQNNIYLHECMETENCDSDNSESSDKITNLGTYLFPISDIVSIYSRELPSPETMDKILPKGEALEIRHFCIAGYCESMVTGVSPVGGYVGPHRGVGRHVQNQPYCNCAHLPYTFGPQTTTPVPMAMRPYLYQYFTPKNSSNCS